MTRSTFTECSKRTPSGSKKLTRFVAKNGSVMKSNKKAKLVGDLARELVAKKYAIVAENC
jgi:hypothetical protein